MAGRPPAESSRREPGNPESLFPVDGRHHEAHDRALSTHSTAPRSQPITRPGTMQRLPTFLALALLVGFAAVGSASAESQRVVKDTAPLPKGWADVGAASRDDTVKVLLSLKPATADASERIKKHALACADPDDAANYGAHLSMAEVNALRAPAPEALQRVLAFFAGQAAPRTAKPSANSKANRATTRTSPRFSRSSSRGPRTQATRKFTTSSARIASMRGRASRRPWTWRPSWAWRPAF